MMARNFKIGNLIFIVTVILLTIFYWRYDRWKLTEKCKLEIRRNLYVKAINFDVGLIDNHNFGIMKLPGELEWLPYCPSCYGEYIYHPVSGIVIDGLPLSPNTRAVAWCPKPCHSGGRVVIFENGESLWIDENDFEQVRMTSRLGRKLYERYLSEQTKTELKARDENKTR